MPDITMCDGKNCDLANNCVRYRSTPDYYQSYFASTPVDEDGNCDHYWPIKEDDKKDDVKK